MRSLRNIAATIAASLTATMPRCSCLESWACCKTRLRTSQGNACMLSARHSPIQFPAIVFSWIQLRQSCLRGLGSFMHAVGSFMHSVFTFMHALQFFMHGLFGFVHAICSVMHATCSFMQHALFDFIHAICSFMHEMVGHARKVIGHA